MNPPDSEKLLPSGIEAEVCRDIALRQQKGIEKYGQSVSENPLTKEQWQRHLYEELLDAAVYLKRLMAFSTPPKPEAGTNKTCSKCGYDGPMPFHTCGTKESGVVDLDSIAERWAKAYIFGPLEKGFAYYCLLALEEATAPLVRKVEEVDRELPETFYADRPIKERLNRLVSLWIHGVNATQKLQDMNDDLTRKNGELMERLKPNFCKHSYDEYSTVCTKCGE